MYFYQICIHYELYLAKLTDFFFVFGNSYIFLNGAYYVCIIQHVHNF